MLSLGPIRAAIEAAIDGLQPDDRYSLTQSGGLEESWTVSPDSSEAQGAIRDLTATVRIGGWRMSGRALLYTVAIGVVCSNYSDTRTRTSSLSPITALDRLDGAARHLADHLSDLSLSGSLLQAEECSEPETSPDREWVSCVIRFTLTTER